MRVIVATLMLSTLFTGNLFSGEIRGNEILEDGDKTARALWTAFDESKPSSERCEIISALSKSGNDAVKEELAKLVSSPNKDIRLCASRAAGESKNDKAIDRLLENIRSYQMSAEKGYYEENLKEKLAAIDSIWALGEIGGERVIRELRKIYARSDEVLRVNVIISIGKTKSPQAMKIMERITRSDEPVIIRATAWEMIDYMTREEEQWAF